MGFELEQLPILIWIVFFAILGFSAVLGALTDYHGNVRLNAQFTSTLSPAGHTITHCRIFGQLSMGNVQELLDRLDREAKNAEGVIIDARETEQISQMALLSIESSKFSLDLLANQIERLPVRGLFPEERFAQYHLAYPFALSPGLDEALESIDEALALAAQTPDRRPYLKYVQEG